MKAFRLQSIGASICSFVILAIPLTASAVTLPSLIPCDGTRADPCDFKAFIQGINGVISWLIIISVPLATIAFAYAGFLYLTSQGNSGQVSKAHGIFISVLTGVIFILGAWVIVRLVVNSLAKPEYQNILR